ncbi:hypothetical protein [Nonomuraea sp. KM90]|uniref:hypothetical protein n=1 Tax=Nonomuraea sp. KM90 TaxID=3457428 RepID=UPI003FCD4FAD
MILVYAVPVVVAVASLFVTSRSSRRKTFYLFTTLAALIAVLLIAWTAGREAWGFGLFFVLPAVFITGIRLVVAFVVGSTDAADDLSEGCSSGCSTELSEGVQDGPRTPSDLH